MADHKNRKEPPLSNQRRSAHPSRQASGAHLQQKVTHKQPQPQKAQPHATRGHAAQPRAPKGQSATPSRPQRPAATKKTIGSNSLSNKLKLPPKARNKIKTTLQRGQRGEGQPSPIVPSQAIAGRALMLVVAIMSFLACLTVGFVSIVNDAANDWTSDLVREVTIQIRPADGVNMIQEIDRTLALVQEFPGVGGARALSDKETRDLLQPWLGAGLELDDLPVPRLILVEVADPLKLDLQELKKTVEHDIKASSVDDHRLWTRQLSAMASGTVVGGFIILALVLCSMVLSVVFATRAAMSGNKDVVEVLHFVGAEDSFIANEFQRHFLILGLKGGLIGGTFATLCFFAISLFGNSETGSVAASQLQTLFGTISVSAAGYLGILAIIFLVAILTALTSRLAVHAHLANME
ncbi:cell division protein FtsX [Polycladidibacter stylochi]|uniref:cell division protein FtsX n=1 Tax=Polycladidibacter stylochi TaxID=1807766 RepID=UPI000A3E2741|nr:ABC transporter permease [Pseudovibrio stylochi]